MVCLMPICSCNRPPNDHRNNLSQQMEIVWAVSEGGDSSIKLSGLEGKLKNDEIAELQKAGVKGVLLVRMAGTVGEAHEKKARVVIVMNKQIRGPIDLPQPDGTNVIYLQQSDTFEKIPDNTKTLSAVIHLIPARVSLSPNLSQNTECTRYEIKREDGGGYGGTALIWNGK